MRISLLLVSSCGLTVMRAQDTRFPPSQQISSLVTALMKVNNNKNRHTGAWFYVCFQKLHLKVMRFLHHHVWWHCRICYEYKRICSHFNTCSSIQYIWNVNAIQNRNASHNLSEKAYCYFSINFVFKWYLILCMSVIGDVYCLWNAKL